MLEARLESQWGADSRVLYVCFLRLVQLFWQHCQPSLSLSNIVLKQWELFGSVILLQISKLVLTSRPVKVPCCRLENWINLNVLFESVAFVFLLSSCLPERWGVILIHNMLECGGLALGTWQPESSRCSFPFYSSSESHVEIPNVPVSSWIQFS